MIDVHVDTSRLESAIAEFAAASGKSLEESMRQSGATMVGQLIGVTPPGHQAALTADGAASKNARIAGEKQMTRDITKLFPTTKLPQEQIAAMIEGRHKWLAENGRTYPVAEAVFSEADLKRVHLNARNPKTGRTNAGYGANMAVTRAAVRKEYLKKALKKVGLLSAGWINAARELKTPARYLPAWIKRHGAGPGGAQVRKNGMNVLIRIYNSNGWFGPGWNSRLSYVVSRAEKYMTKAAEQTLERNAKKAQARLDR